MGVDALAHCRGRLCSKTAPNPLCDGADGGTPTPYPLYLPESRFVRWKRLSLEADGHPLRGLAKSPVPPPVTTVGEPGIFAFVTYDRIVAWLQSHAQGRLP